MCDYQTRTLPNGVRIISERMPGVRSATIGIWVGTGSRSESAQESGAAHFIEHMLFKGTEHCTAAQLARRMDAIGGQVNAFTTKECTCFYAKALDTHLPEALDILCEMFFRARFDNGDAETERSVILEEIHMYEDDPSDLVAERLAAAIYKGNALARPILGRAGTLEKMDGDWLRAYQRSHYLPSRVVVALAGSFDARVLDEIADRFFGMTPGDVRPVKPAVYRPAFTQKKKATEQNHLLLAFPALSQSDPRRFSLQLLSSVLGGGMSSRLFQEVREKRGLCYSVYSYGSAYSDIGVLALYTALNRETETRALEAISAVVRAFTQSGVTPEELTLAREQSKANVLMGLESTTARMHHLARSVLQDEPLLTPEELITAYDAVTAEDILALSREIFDFSRLSFSAVGRVAETDAYRALLQG